MVPHRHRRARSEGPAHGRGATASPRRTGPTGWSNARPGSPCWSTSTSRTTTSSAPRRSGTTDRVQEFVQDLYDKGEIYEAAATRALYCVGCEEYKLPGELRRRRRASTRGTKLCPIHTEAGRSILSEENYFFKLSEYSERLLAHYERQPGLHPARVRAQRGRRLRPPGPAGPLHLPLDLRLGRAGALGRQARHLRVGRRAARTTPRRSATTTNPEKFESTFPADVHLVGKDILRFHAIIWPAMLMAQGLPLPGRSLANGWLMVGGEKMTKSNLTGIKPQDLTTHFGVGRVPLVLPARDRVRPGRQLLLGGHLRPLHQRAGQRLRQPGLARGGHGQQVLRRGAAGRDGRR